MSGWMNLILPSEAKGKICVNPREFNVIKKEHVALAQFIILTLNATAPKLFFL